MILVSSVDKFVVKVIWCVCFCLVLIVIVREVVFWVKLEVNIVGKIKIFGVVIEVVKNIGVNV